LDLTAFESFIFDEACAMALEADNKRLEAEEKKKKKAEEKKKKFEKDMERVFANDDED